MPGTTDITSVVIVGAGGHGAEIGSFIQEMASVEPSLRLLGFIDEHRARGFWGAGTILGDFKDLRNLLLERNGAVVRYITAVGDNELRRQIVEKAEGLKITNLVPWTLRHPSALIGRDVEVGDGTCLAPGAVLTTRIRIGKHCILNLKASISHDCVLGDFVNINPAATLCGNVTVGAGSFIGAGAVVKEKIIIGRGVTVGAGAVVIRDLPDGATAVGVPARIIKQNPVDWLQA